MHRIALPLVILSLVLASCRDTAGPPTDPLLVLSSITAGPNHTCGLTTAGAAYCWGGNDGGQLGDGAATENRLIPQAVAGERSFSAITAGWRHTCGLTTAGAAYCWGWNSSGELGDGTTAYRLTPQAVAGERSFSAITAGEAHTCGLTPVGAAYCWGWNDRGQLGDGTTTSLRLTPTAVADGPSFSAITAGGHTCGLTTAGAAYCWGGNTSGQLGDGTTAIGIGRLTPTAVAGARSFSAITAGMYHTCGLTTAGAAYCWGGNLWGQLGDGTTTERLTPQAVNFRSP